MKPLKAVVVAVVLLISLSCLAITPRAQDKVETAKQGRPYQRSLNKSGYDIYKIRHLEDSYLKIRFEAGEDSGVFLKITDEENFTQEETDWRDRYYSSGNDVVDITYYTDDDIYVNISYQNSTYGHASYSFKFDYVSLSKDQGLTSTAIGVALGAISFTVVLILLWLWIYFKRDTGPEDKEEEE